MKLELKLTSEDDTEAMELALRADDMRFALVQIKSAIYEGGYPSIKERFDEIIANMELKGFL